MNKQDLLHLSFAVFALLAVGLLIVLFMARLWKPVIEERFGWLTYAMSLPALILAILLIANGERWYFWLPPIIYTAWSILGWVVDLWRPVEWRSPARLSIFIPYVVLFIASMAGFWVPLWFINLAFWISFAALYMTLLGLIIFSHVRKAR